MDGSGVLIELYGRVVPLAQQAVAGLSPDELARAPAGANPIGWLIWHLARVQDHQLSEVFGEQQVWLESGWAERFGLEPDPNNPHSAPGRSGAQLAGAPKPGLQLRAVKPLHAGTTVSFSMPAMGPVNLSVFDVQGRAIRTLVQDTYAAGDHAVTWDGRNASGLPVSSGVYFFNLDAVGQQETAKITLTR